MVNTDPFSNVSRQFPSLQAVIRPTKVVEQLVEKVKSNPLKNRAAMVKLNPFHDAVRKREQEKKAAALKQRGEKLAKKRAGVKVRQRPFVFSMFSGGPLLVSCGVDGVGH